MDAPTIRRFSLGPFETNCYVVSPAEGSECWIVDMGFEPGELIEHVRAEGLTPSVVVLTHCHADHIAGLFEFRKAFPDTPIWVHSAERRWLSEPELNLSAAMGVPITAPTPDRLLEGGESLELGALTWRVLHTPGHSPGGITLVNDRIGVAFVGDTLFAGSIGRHDFPNADFETLANSIRTKLYQLPDDTRVLPGHGPDTTIAREKRSNPFVRPL